MNVEKGGGRPRLRLRRIMSVYPQTINIVTSLSMNKPIQFLKTARGVFIVWEMFVSCLRRVFRLCFAVATARCYTRSTAFYLYAELLWIIKLAGCLFSPNDHKNETSLC